MTPNPIPAASTLQPETTQPNGVALIAAERERQISVEGWTAEHDDSRTKGELARAAACYAHFAGEYSSDGTIWREIGNRGDENDRMPGGWPFHPSWWKPSFTHDHTARMRELVKAGALIVAEIDRLQRAIAAEENT